MTRKNRFNKYQAGGAMTPLAYYTPSQLPSVAGQSGRASTSSSVSESSKSEKLNYGLTKQDVMKGLANLLPSDMKIVSNDVNSLMNLIDMNDEFDGAFMSEVNHRMIELQMKINIGQQAKADYENSMKDITKNNAQDEIALTQYGEALTMDKNGNIRKIKIDDIGKAKNILTYGDISYIRKNMPKYAYDENILNVMRQSASMDDIMKDIYDVVAKIGSVKTEENYFGKRQGSYITNGLAGIIQDGVDGVYDIKDTKDASTREQKMYAIDTVISNMSNNKRNALYMRAKLNNTTPQEIVYKVIAMSEKPQYLRNVSWKAFPKEGNSSDKDGSSGAKTGINAARAVQEMYGDMSNLIFTNGQDTNGAQSVRATMIKLNPKVDAQGLVNLSKMKEVGINGAVDFSNASIAGQHIDDVKLGEFVSGNEAYVMYMPYKTDNDGHIVVDFNSFSQIKPANDYIIQNFGSVNTENYQKVNQKMNELGFNLQFNANGEPVNKNIRKFVAFNVKAGYKTFDKLNLENSPFVNMEESNMNADRIAKSTGVKSTDGYTLNFLGAWTTEDRTGSSVIFMPTVSSAINASIGDQTPMLKEDLGTDVGQIDKAHQQHKQKPTFQQPTIEID